MNLIELENLTKEMREQGAKDETEIDFLLYYDGVISYSEWNIYLPETSPEFIEIIFK
jgi:hypothetical protein